MSNDNVTKDLLVAQNARTRHAMFLRRSFGFLFYRSFVIRDKKLARMRILQEHRRKARRAATFPGFFIPIIFRWFFFCKDHNPSSIRYLRHWKMHDIFFPSYSFIYYPNERMTSFQKAPWRATMSPSFLSIFLSSFIIIFPQGQWISWILYFNCRRVYEFLF